jgi:hypothetical protein
MEEFRDLYYSQVWTRMGGAGVKRQVHLRQESELERTRTQRNVSLFLVCVRWLFEAESHFVAKVGLKCTFPLPQPLECLRRAPLYQETWVSVAMKLQWLCHLN